MSKLKEQSNIETKPKKLTPVAGRFYANTVVTGNKSFSDVKDRISKITRVEQLVYDKIKGTLIHHVRLHGLDTEAEKYFYEFKDLNGYDQNECAKLLAKVRRAYSKNPNNRSLEYLISKIVEYEYKIREIAKQGYDMIMAGKEPDFEVWCDKVALQDAVFEENKQFLKQTIHHIESLKMSNYELGINEIKLLLYNKQGCRREKLYRQVESLIINIYCELPDNDAKQQIYKEICYFVRELIPDIGYVSPTLVWFIFRRNFLSKSSRDLLLSIKPILVKFSMDSLIIANLRPMFLETTQHILNGKINDSDIYVWDVASAYDEKSISNELRNNYAELLLNSKF